MTCQPGKAVTASAGLFGKVQLWHALQWYGVIAKEAGLTPSSGKRIDRTGQFCGFFLIAWPIDTPRTEPPEFAVASSDEIGRGPRDHCPGLRR